MPTTEHTINDALAALLRKTRHVWRTSNIVGSEQLGMLEGNAKRPDILVLEPNVSPVCIEVEVAPGATLESDATKRLGERLRSNGRSLLSCVAVEVPRDYVKKQGHALSDALEAARDIKLALYTGSSPEAFARWPQRGWIEGGLPELSVLTQSASLPPEVVERAADDLADGVKHAAGMIAEMGANHPGAIAKIGEQLKQHGGEQTLRMAATILANAFVFQGSLAGGPGDLAAIASLEQLLEDGKLNQSGVLDEWRRILKINYWPIFDIARRILVAIPPEYSGGLVASVAKTASRLLENRMMRSHDLTGAVFQKLIVDRKFLAAYYTTPASAALVAGLAISGTKPSREGVWSSAEDATALRVADFACGTGTLLSAAYQRIGQLHELNGGDAEAIHPAMMANALVGCDILPAAAHLTASMLAGAHPTAKYTKSSILTVAYGKQPDKSVALGSLDLLESQGRFDILAITAKAAEGMGEAERKTWAALPHGTFDLVIMNPPFTRATGHHEINNVGVPNPMFAAFRSGKEEQEQMSAATRKLTKNTSAHGNAGEASIFLVLANRKLKAYGMLGLVMPVSLMTGGSWERSRVALKKNFRDLIVISIAGVDSAEVSFSADTAMGECVVVGQKVYTGGSERAVFVVLKRPPSSTLAGASCARQIQGLIAAKQLRRIEDGPVGGTSLYFGEDELGQVLDAPLPAEGGWNLSRVSDIAIGQSAFQLANEGRIWLPGMREKNAKEVPISTIGAIGSVGPVDRDINGAGKKGAIRGPFKKVHAKPDTAPTYPILWSHDADRERTMAFGHDSEGRPLAGSTPAKQEAIAEKVATIAATASHCHFNRDFRFNSQSTAMRVQQVLRVLPGGYDGGTAYVTNHHRSRRIYVRTDDSSGGTRTRHQIVHGLAGPDHSGG